MAMTKKERKLFMSLALAAHAVVAADAACQSEDCETRHLDALTEAIQNLKEVLSQG